jgi:hypothetical protein
MLVAEGWLGPKGGAPMNAHTPGPWRMNGTLITSQADLATAVASVYRPGIGHAAKTDTEYAANVRLIASAPELLAALKDMVMLWDAKYLAADQKPPISPKVERARAAVARCEKPNARCEKPNAI